MTKEELEKEAEKYFKSICKDYNEELERTGKRHYWVGFDIKDGYIAGAEPREKRIAELEKENVELREKLEDAEKIRDYWKESSFDWRHECTSRKSFKVAAKAQRQLTKAKELIEELSSSLSVVGECVEEECELLNRAEQFLKENIELKTEVFK